MDIRQNSQQRVQRAFVLRLFRLFLEAWQTSGGIGGTAQHLSMDVVDVKRSMTWTTSAYVFGRDILTTVQMRPHPAHQQHRLQRASAIDRLAHGLAQHVCCRRVGWRHSGWTSSGLRESVGWAWSVVTPRSICWPAPAVAWAPSTVRANESCASPARASPVSSTRVTVLDGVARCSCTGFQYRGGTSADVVYQNKTQELTHKTINLTDTSKGNQIIGTVTPDLA
jgi:hypothetical protein